MFAVPECVPYRKRFAEKLRRKKAVQRVRVPVPGGASFFRLIVPTYGEMPWQAVQAAVGTLPVLLPDGVHAPEDVPLRVFVPQRFPLLCAAQTAAFLLRQRAPIPSLGVLDPGGALRGKAAILLPVAREVRIVTDRPERFAEDVQIAMREWGAALTVGRERTLLRNCTAILCENGDDVSSAEAVFCVRQSMQRADTVCLSRFVPPPDLDALRPAKIDPLLFAAALYELCGVRMPERCRFADFHAGTQSAGFFS